MTTESHETASRKRRWPWILLGLLIAVVLVSQGYRAMVRASVRRELDALRQQGLPQNARELQSWQKPVPDQQNAALRVLEAADTLFTDGETFKHWPERGEELGPTERDDLRDSLTNNVQALAAVHAAALLPQSIYPIDYSRGPNTLLPHLAKVKSLAQLLRAESTLLCEEGQIDRAVTSIRDSIALARTLDKEPILISQLVRDACLAISCSSLERVLTQRALKESQLVELGQSLQGAREVAASAFEAGYLGELCLGAYCFEASPQEIRETLGGGSDSDGPLIGLMLPLYVWSGLRDRDFRFYLRSMRGILEDAKNFPQNVKSAKERGRQTVASLESDKLLLFSRMLLPALEKSTDKAVEIEARLRCAQAALAVERYRAAHQGQLPAELTSSADPVFAKLAADPIDGAPLRYLRLEPGYSIYSIGVDGTDDGGVERGRAGEGGARKWPPSRDASGTNKPQNNSTKGYDVSFIVER